MTTAPGMQGFLMKGGWFALVAGAMDHVEKQRYGQAHFTFRLGATIVEALNSGNETDPIEYQRAAERVNASGSSRAVLEDTVEAQYLATGTV